MNFYKLGCWSALTAIGIDTQKMGVAAGGQPSRSPTPQAGQNSSGKAPAPQKNVSTTLNKPSTGDFSTPAKKDVPAPGSGPFPTTQTGLGSTPAAPSLTPGVTGNNAASSSNPIGPSTQPKGVQFGTPGPNPFK